MPLKPQVASQLMSSMGMARLGGSAAKASSKPVNKGKGQNFAALEQALLKKGVKKPSDAKRVTQGPAARHFLTQASGGEQTLGKPKSDTPIKTQPGGPLKGAWSRNYGKVS